MEWKTSPGLVPYEESSAFMEERAGAIREGRADEMVWLLEHPPLYTAGTGAQDADLLEARFPVHRTGRGGQFTYHGPGQRIAYVMLDLQRRTPDLRLYVRTLEQWLIDTVAAFGVRGERREGRVGVWVPNKDEHPFRMRGGVLHDDPAGELARSVNGGGAPPVYSGEAKIAALGVRVRRWVTLHGVALNVAPDLSHYAGIVPCGVREHGVTSLAALGVQTDMQTVDAMLRKHFSALFQPLTGESI